MTLLAVGLLAPAPALGDCSHPGGRPAIEGDLFGLALDGDGADPGSDPLPRPCTGPECSGRSSPPLAPASPLVPPRAKLWAVMVEPAADPGAESAAWWPVEPRSRPIRISPSIFHPPQLPR